MIELRFRTLITTTLASLMALLALVTIFGVLRYQQFSATSRSSRVVTASISPNLVAPVLGEIDTVIEDAAARWDASFVVSPESLQAALIHRYPGLHKRFPDGVLLTVVDDRYAPESLRGPYDQNPTELLEGAVYPQPQPGERVFAEAEAWASCRRDLELGPARQLHCYLFAQGEPGDTLDGLAALAWIQAMDITLSGSMQPLQPASLPLVTITQEKNQWTYADSYLSLSPAASAASSPSP